MAKKLKTEATAFSTAGQAPVIEVNPSTRGAARRAASETQKKNGYTNTASSNKSDDQTQSPRVRSKKQAKKDNKIKRDKVIRDSFTLPVDDYALLGVLKKKCLALGIEVKKSELVRAGLATLNQLSSNQLKQVIANVERVKTGRPMKDKK